MGKRKIAFLLIVALFITSGLFRMITPLAGTTDREEDGPIIIGHIAALSGDAAVRGQSEKQALEIMVDDINAGGGVLGRPLQLICYDNTGDQSGTFAAANRLAADKAVAIVGPSHSGLCITAAQVLETAGIVMISTTSANQQLTVPADHTEPPKYIFSTDFTDAEQAAKAAAFAIDYLGVGKAGILKDSSSDYSLNLAACFEKAFAQKGGVIVADESFQAGKAEFTGQLSRIKESGAGLLFVPTIQGEGKLIIRQAKEMELDCRFLGGDAWAGGRLTGPDNEILEGSFLINISPTMDSVMTDWVERYIKNTGEKPVMPNAALAGDALCLIVEGIKATKSTDSGRLADWLANCRDVQVLTGIMTMNPDTHSPLNRQAVIETVANGQFTSLF